jgi:hypothetical protein
MKTRFAATDLDYMGKIYQEGSVEIDDEMFEITFRAIKKNFFSKKEIFLEISKYGPKTFPQFQSSEFTAGKVSCLVLSDVDKQKIMAILTKPLAELRTKTIDNVSEAEESVRKMLLGRADSLEYLAYLRANPRKALFRSAPEILADSDNPVDAAVQQQKKVVSESLSIFKEELSAQLQRNQIDQATSDALQRLAIVVAAVQNAIFQSDEAELRAANELRHSTGLTTSIPTGESSKSITAALIDEFNSKNHQTLVNNLLGMIQCISCRKYFEVNATQRCPHCNTLQK